LHELGKERSGSHFAYRLLGGFDATNLEKGSTSRSLSFHARGDLLVGEKFDIRQNLCAEVGIAAPGLHDIPT
jgi:hypothetical protein